MTDDTDDLIDEIRMAFGGGTQTLELYVTPKMLEPRAWDALAEAASWARENGNVLADSHFVGGDPGEGQPYGYACWSHPFDAYMAWIEPAGIHPPQSLLGVNRLVFPDLLVEIEVTAAQ